MDWKYKSTIYWKHAVFVGPKETAFRFYTSDINGPFNNSARDFIK